jgi:peroxiredoxin Q/BCP
MPVQLRKRKAPDAAPSGAPPAKKPNAVKAAVSKVKSKLSNGNATASKAVPSGVKPSKINVGDVISLEGFGGTIQTQDGEETTLKALVDKSKGGVVLFTYPKASTPGCKSEES